MTRPINFTAVTNILDRAHRALRGIDAADLSNPIPDREIAAVSDAIAAIEEFARERRIVLSEK